MKEKKYWVVILACLVALAIGVVAGSWLVEKKTFSLFASKDIEESKLDTILDYIDKKYVDSIPIDELIEKAIPRFIEELDPHSSYIPVEEASLYNQEIEGAFGGIGIEVNFNSDTIIVNRITAGGPAEQAGLIPGDRIISIDELSYFEKGKSTDEILDLLRGETGSQVKIDILRDNREDMTFTIVRDFIPLNSIVSYEVAPEIGFIRINDKFTHKTYDEFIRALAKLKASGCKDFIIDLRENGGGVAEGAINIANEFLSAGKLIVQVKGKDFPEEFIYANGTGAFQDGQLVVLIDQLSASASEILAGAIQDNDRGLIVGRRSYGKGLVQNLFDLNDGSILRLTVARYFTPSGRNIQRPYEYGKTKEYNQEWFDLLMSEESFHGDSIKFNAQLEYRTLKGRPVYGGGGIIPDIFIPADTSATSYYINLEKQDLFNQFAFHYSDSNRELLKQFKTQADMLDYLKGESILWDIVQFAETKGVRRRSNLIYRSSKQILTSTYAYILRNFFGENAFFSVYMEEDPMVRTAITAIQNREAHIE